MIYVRITAEMAASIKGHKRDDFDILSVLGRRWGFTSFEELPRVRLVTLSKSYL